MFDVFNCCAVLRGTVNQGGRRLMWCVVLVELPHGFFVEGDPQ